MFSALFSELMALGASPPPGTVAHSQVVSLPVDPLTVDDDDFARHRDPSEWKGLKVSRVEFVEWGVSWRLWMIEAVARRDGPLWVVPHDNENAAFEASLVAARAYGGTIVRNAAQRGVNIGDERRQIVDRHAIVADVRCNNIRRQCE